MKFSQWAISQTSTVAHRKELFISKITSHYNGLKDDHEHAYVWLHKRVHISTFFPLALQPSAGLWPPLSRCFLITHNDAPQSVGLLWTSDQFVADTSTWQLTTRVTNIHAPRGIRTHDRSRRAAADLRLRPRGHWDRRTYLYTWSVSELIYCTVYYDAGDGTMVGGGGETWRKTETFVGGVEIVLSRTNEIRACSNNAQAQTLSKYQYLQL
jgi:hypothetical protein